MFLAIDQGTTGSTCIVFDHSGEPLGRAYREFTQHFPKPGWVEHDAAEIWEVTQAVALEAIDDAGVEPVALGITNQRETIVVWDPSTGAPLHHALVWQDRRTAARTDELREQGQLETVRASTGLVLDPYFSATKIEWLLQNVDGLRDRMRDGTALIGTIESWLVWNLTGEHVTDVTNASRTLLYDLPSGDWSPRLLELFGDVPAAALPRIVPSCGVVGETRPDALGGRTIPVAGLAGDQQSALFGQACLDPGLAKATYGTGSFVLLNAGSGDPPVPPPGILATVAWGIGERRSYALEASILVAGAAVQWLRDGLGVIKAAAETEALAASLEDNGDVWFVPALTGLGSPHWDPYARGTIVGLTRGTGTAHLARAALEGIAHQVCDAVEAMDRAAARPLGELRADGGAAENRWLMQHQADLCGVPVVVPEVTETTALGAALLAAVGVGELTLDAVRNGWRERERFEPRIGGDERAELRAGWAKALARAKGFAAS